MSREDGLNEIHLGWPVEMSSASRAGEAGFPTHANSSLVAKGFHALSRAYRTPNQRILARDGPALQRGNNPQNKDIVVLSPERDVTF